MKRMVKRKVNTFYKIGLEKKITTVLEEDLEGLPLLIQDYLKKINLIGKERIIRVKLQQKGAFKLKPKSEWKSFSAKQYINTDTMSFLWYAKIKMIPLLNFHVIDEFIEGKGGLKAKLFNLITIVNEMGKKLDQGEFLRFLSEAPWYPSFYINDQIIWNQISENTLRLKIKKKNIEISGQIVFNENGFVKEFYAKRYFTRKKDITLEDWHGYFEDYKSFNEILIPTSFKVCWHLNDEVYCYIKGKIVEVEFNEPQ